MGAFRYAALNRKLFRSFLLFFWGVREYKFGNNIAKHRRRIRYIGLPYHKTRNYWATLNWFVYEVWKGGLLTKPPNSHVVFSIFNHSHCACHHSNPMRLTGILVQFKTRAPGFVFPGLFGQGDSWSSFTAQLHKQLCQQSCEWEWVGDNCCSGNQQWW